MKMDARMDIKNLIKSLSFMDELYGKAGFNDKAKSGTLRKVATEHVRLVEFLLSIVPGSYETLK